MHQQCVWDLNVDWEVCFWEKPESEEEDEEEAYKAAMRQAREDKAKFEEQEKARLEEAARFAQAAVDTSPPVDTSPEEG